MNLLLLSTVSCIFYCTSYKLRLWMLSFAVQIKTEIEIIILLAYSSRLLAILPQTTDHLLNFQSYQNSSVSIFLSLLKL